MSNITIGQIMMDAQRMAGRVKDLETLGSALLIEAEGNNRLVESLRQFQEDMDSLNRISNNKSNAEMVNRIQQQNANSSEILKENRELKVCIEDYERAMELIMQKYREHTTSKVLESKLNFKEVYNEKLWKIIREQREKINEMAAVMQRAATADDDAVNRNLEAMSRLRLENKTLRELLQISKQFGTFSRPIRYNEHLLEEKAVQTETDDSADELSLSGASIENANNNSVIQLSTTSIAAPLASTAVTAATATAAAAATDNTPQSPSGIDNNNGPPPSTGKIVNSTLPNEKKAEVIATVNTELSTSTTTPTVTPTVTATPIPIIPPVTVNSNVAVSVESVKSTAASAT